MSNGPTAADWKDDETEIEAARKAYESVAEITPTERLPDDFEEPEAAIVVGVDADDNFHVIAVAPESKQRMMSFSMDVVRDVLSNFTAYKEIYENRKSEDSDEKGENQ